MDQLLGFGAIKWASGGGVGDGGALSSEESYKTKEMVETE